MLQAIKGYFQENEFIPLQQVEIPNHVEVFVVVTDKPVLTHNKENDCGSYICEYGHLHNYNNFKLEEYKKELENSEGGKFG